MKAIASTLSGWFPAAAVCLAVLAGIGAAGYLYIAVEERSFEAEVRNQLGAVAELKVQELVAWREERIADARILGVSLSTLIAGAESLSGGRNRAEIEAWMGRLLGATSYTAVGLFDRDNELRVWLPAGDSPHDLDRQLILQSMRTKVPLLGDLRRDDPMGAARMALAVPILRSPSSEPLAALLLEINPAHFFYPLIQSWPTPSRSAETLLVRREGNDVVFLNELRHQKDTALKLRFPIASAPPPAAKGALGYEGALEGLDYRGVRVIAVTKGVPGSSWIMVVKVDREEVLAPLHKRTRLIAGFFGLAGVTLIVGILLLWSRQAAKAVHTSEVRYRRLFESAKDGILILDALTGTIVDVNPFLIELLGFPREAFLGKRLLELESFGNIAANRAYFLELLQKEYLRYDSILLESAGGRRIAVEFVSNVYFVGNQKVIQCNIRDITERQRTEDALRESERKFRAVLETTSLLGVMLDQEGNIILCNDFLLALTGWTREEVLHRNWFELFIPPEARREIYEEIFLKTIASGELPVHHRNEIITRTGERRLVEWNNSMIRDTNGQFVGVASIGEDITERKLAEQELRAKEETLSESQSIAHVGSWRWEVATGTNLILWTPETYRIYGVSPDAFVPTTETLLSLLHPDDRAAMQAWMEACLAGEAPPDLEVRASRPDGSVRHILGRGHLVRNAEGKPIRMTGIVQDITERKLAEEERNSLQLQLAQAQKMESIGHLSGGVAHDFNNLLTVINGYGQLLLGKFSLGDPLRTDVEQILRAGERAAVLTRQLLAYSRKQILQPHVLDLNRILGEMRPMVERLVGEDVEVCARFGSETGMVRADPHQLEQVIMNLVVNSSDAMPRGGKLLVETGCVELDETYAQSHPEAHVGRYVMLAVSDSGVGMNEEVQQHIFEPFFTTKGVGKGTGLGLSMVQGVVVQSGGSIEVSSKPGQGTTFKIYLPRIEEEAVEEKVADTAPVLRGSETVLLVEDEAEVRRYVVTVLRSQGFRVVEVENPAEALSLCEPGGEHIDLLLTDVIMPKVSGRELADQVKRLRPGIKVLFMSGYSGNRIEVDGFLEESTSFIQKPFSREQLITKVREVLGPMPSPARILVADDDGGVRSFLRKVLEQGGYEVTEAVDGKPALNQVRAGRVDLVITDLIMPDQEGIETIRSLRREIPGIGIIAVSGALDPIYLPLAEKLGADAVMNKPVGVESLLAKVAEVLKRR